MPAELVERTSFGADFDRVAYTHEVVDALEPPRRRPGRDGRLRHDPRRSRSTTPSRTASSTPTRRCCRRSRAGTRSTTRSPPGVKVTGCTVHIATPRGRRRPDPRPGGGAGPARRHRRDAARAHQGGRAPALPRRAPAARPKTSRSTMRTADHEGAAVRLRQDRDRRASPRACTSSAWELVSSGGTAKALADAGIPVTDVADVTGVPAILDHRVVTLHPKIHGGILADRSKDPRTAPTWRTYGIEPIDLVVSNLYPFASDPAIELIDIGGPTMVRAAAKNHAHVGIVTDPPTVRRRCSTSCARNGAPSATTTRRALRARGLRAHRRLRRRDRRVARRRRRAAARRTSCLALERTDEALRYGENPHQHGARYRAGRHDELVGRRRAAQRHRAVATSTSTTPTPRGSSPTTSATGRRCAIIKHANPCGAAVADDLADRVPAGVRVRRALGVRRDRGAEPPGRRRDRRAHGRRPAGRRRDRARLRRRARSRRCIAQAQEHPPPRGAGAARAADRSTSARSAAASWCRTPHHFAADPRRLAGRHQGGADRRPSGATPSWRGASAAT